MSWNEEEEREIEREIFKASGEDFLCGMCGKVYAAVLIYSVSCLGEKKLKDCRRENIRSKCHE